MTIIPEGLLLLISAASMVASPGEISVRANKQVVAGVVLHLRGQVEIVLDKKRIIADEADYNVDTGDLEARGNLRGARIGRPVDASPVIDKLNMNTKTPDKIVLLMHSRPGSN